MNPNDDNLDRLLHEHFDKTLGSHVGRAEESFRSQLSARPSSLRFPIWIFGALVTAAAAVWAVWVVRPTPPTTPAQQRATTPIIASTTPADALTQYTNFQQTLDDGLVYLDDQTPVRKLRRQEVQQIQWLDDDGKTQMRVTVPKEQVYFVECTKY